MDSKAQQMSRHTRTVVGGMLTVRATCKTDSRLFKGPEAYIAKHTKRVQPLCDTHLHAQRNAAGSVPHEQTTEEEPGRC
jgi:hypothetical protein